MTKTTHIKSLTIIMGLLAATLAPYSGSIAISHIDNRQATEDDPAFTVRPYEFPEYSNAWGYTRADGTMDAIEKYWNEEDYTVALRDNRFIFSKLIYPSDGHNVVTYLYRSREITEQQPVIIFNRGSGIQNDIAPVLLPYMHRLAEAGFVVMAPMYRQSDGADGQDANGGEDLNDLFNILPVIHALPGLDSSNIFMTGESRGAMMIYQAIRDDFPMRAAAVWGGFSNLQELFDRSPGLLEYATQNWPGFDANNPQADVERRSAIFWPERFGVPVLLMHGESDESVPVSHTYDLASRLQAHNKLYGLIVFADDNHILSRSQHERDRASINWFKRFSTQAEAEKLTYLRTAADEREIRQYSNSILKRGHMDKALEIFRVYVDRFPTSPYAHFSLGEALDAGNDKQGAISAFERALELVTGESDKAYIRDKLNSLKGM